jgi:uncharacterized protein (TIGR04255 family)
MARVRAHLSRPPITEGLIDFQFDSGMSVDLNHIQRVAESLVDQYKIQAPIYQFSTRHDLQKDGPPQTDTVTQQLGLRLASNDGKYVLQIRTLGFTISRVGGYETWESLVAEAKRLWDICSSILLVENVARVATRFINLLKLPMKPDESFQEYLSTPPDVPETLPQGLLGFMQRVVIIEPKLGLRANVIQMLEEGSLVSDHVPIVLDIDVYKQVAISAGSENLWILLSDLRDFKNEIFFASLTEKTVEIFL